MASNPINNEKCLMATKRDVKRNASGGWDVLREGDRRAAVRVDTKERALARARDVVRREGGGEVRVVNDAGKIVRSSHVSANAQAGVQRSRAA
jgi:uncharacterized protein (DUF2345 family)